LPRLRTVLVFFARFFEATGFHVFMKSLSFMGAAAASCADEGQGFSAVQERAAAGDCTNVKATAAAAAAVMRRLRMIPLLPPTEQAYSVRQA
jgi:hypothetical protein